MRQFIFIFVLAMVCVMFVGCGPDTRSAAAYKEYYLSDSNTSEEIKDAIRAGVVIKGMCPFQAFAAGGIPGPYMVRHDTEVWGDHTYPPDIISAQCENPDNSVIELMFRNKTQFNTKVPEVFRVRFEKGRVVLIDQKAFKED